MRVWEMVAFSVALGIGVGIGASHLRLNWHFGEGESLLPAAGKLEIDQTVYDFGTMESNAKDKHDFTFTNVGEEPLTLEKGTTSCQCTLSDLEVSQIPPGGSAAVTVKWDAKGRSGPFEHTATIITSDPNHHRVELRIKGHVVPPVVAQPDPLVLSKAAVDRETQGEVSLYCYRDEPLEIVDYAWSDEERAPFFEVAFEPIPPEDLPKEPRPKSGLTMRVTAKPGLPLGWISQTIRVKTSFKDVPPVKVPVELSVSSDISIVCFKPDVWDDDNHILSFGLVDGNVGAEEELLIHVFGEYRDQTDIHLAEVEPAQLLRAKLGDKRVVKRKDKEGKDDSAVVFRLTVTIPAGSPAAEYMGPTRAKAGRITIDTTHPHCRKIPLFVHFRIVSPQP